MVRGGMFFGNHCYNHLWLENQEENKQKIEILKGIKFLRKIGMKRTGWIMCYPYGSYNRTTIKILKNNDFFLGLTTINKEYNIKKDSAFEIRLIVIMFLNINENTKIQILITGGFGYVGSKL